MSENHRKDIKNPNDIPTKDQTKNCGDDLALGKARQKAKYQRSYRDDDKNETEKPTKTKVILFAVCHKYIPSFLI